jgi:hypothetical protein
MLQLCTILLSLNTYVTQYLEKYVDSHVYNGTPLQSRIRLNAEVRSIEKSADPEGVGIYKFEVA